MSSLSTLNLIYIRTAFSELKKFTYKGYFCVRGPETARNN